MTYFSVSDFGVSDWDDLDASPMTPVSENPNLTGYKAAPQLLYFAPQRLWYLVYQTQDPAYSTSTDPSDVGSWSAMTRFMTVPTFITDNGDIGIDYWVICDDTDCYMFFSADNGALYRAKTAKTDFPHGFEGTTKIVMQDDTYDLYDACNVYKMAGTNQYLLLVSAIGSVDRYFRAWTADRLDGNWIPLADTESDSFASVNNVNNTDWLIDGINHGEMLRHNPDETMTIDTRNMRYLFQGCTQLGDDYNENVYSLGLLTDAR
jgi:endo-1,4-beta-xylanase